MSIIQRICKKCGSEFSGARCKTCKARYEHEYYLAHREEISERAREYRDTIRERLRAEDRERYHANIELSRLRARIKFQRRKARKNNAGGNFTEDEWVSLCAEYGNRCLACGEETDKLTADHVVPLSAGGSNSIDNIQPLCSTCNCRKFTKVIDYRPMAKGECKRI